MGALLLLLLLLLNLRYKMKCAIDNFAVLSASNNRLFLQKKFSSFLLELFSRMFI